MTADNRAPEKSRHLRVVQRGAKWEQQKTNRGGDLNCGTETFEASLLCDDLRRWNHLVGSCWFDCVERLEDRRGARR